MAVAARLSGSAILPQASSKITVAGGAKLAMIVSDVETLSDLYLALGVTNPGPPSTYADIDGDQGSTLDGWTDGGFSVVQDANTGNFTVTANKLVSGFGRTAADQFWLAVFTAAPTGPGPTDVPDVVVGPLTVIP